MSYHGMFSTTYFTGAKLPWCLCMSYHARISYITTLFIHKLSSVFFQTTSSPRGVSYHDVYTLVIKSTSCILPFYLRKSYQEWVCFQTTSSPPPIGPSRVKVTRCL